MTDLSAWRAPLVVAICVGAEVGLASAPLGPHARVALILGVAALAVGIALAEAVGLRRASRGIRAIILVPLAFCVVVTALLMLESSFRAGLVPR